MKCNDDMQILKLLASSGTGFNCSTEKDLLRALDLGCEPTDLNLTHPFKTRTLLHLARDKGVRKISFDTLEELHLASRIFPDAQLLIRIATYKANKGRWDQSAFGIPFQHTDNYIKAARDLSLSIIGVSFYVEADEAHPDVFRQALVRAVNEAHETMAKITNAGFKVSILDIGGGFTEGGFSEIASALKSALCSPLSGGIELIGEPGRFFVSSAVGIACRVIAKRQRPDGNCDLFVNDSIYDNFANKIHDARNVEAMVLRAKGEYRDVLKGEQTASVSHTIYMYTIRGSTTNNTDILVENHKSGEEIHCGYWLYFPRMGGQLLRLSRCLI
jgi:ornithine decarboxylase